MFGWRARIGQLYPSGGLCDFEPQRMAPPGVQFVTTRMTFRGTRLENHQHLTRAIEEHAQLLADAKVDLIAFNCTAASVVAGPESVCRRITEATGIPATTTIQAVLAALAAVRARRLALVTAYPPEVTAAEVRFLEAQGFEVADRRAEECEHPLQQASIPPDRWQEIALELKDTPADALLISCAGIEIASVLQRIEDDFGRPVIASNQALVWHCLRLLGIPDSIPGFGGLLRREFDAVAA
ncbi:MAG: arylmalonate decarboxylase [Candidatus Rokubacteria bacterium RIFCSPHIGHO2_02_FULL_69_13]|nr:MAG: arylmalonate decarboxylase [Candidatus Rokubacteria bacterium RIFCSPHIGHO2_02_FULL_69_13]